MITFVAKQDASLFFERGRQCLKGILCSLRFHVGREDAAEFIEPARLSCIAAWFGITKLSMMFIADLLSFERRTQRAL